MTRILLSLAILVFGTINAAGQSNSPCGSFCQETIREQNRPASKPSADPIDDASADFLEKLIDAYRKGEKQRPAQKREEAPVDVPDRQPPRASGGLLVAIGATIHGKASDERTGRVWPFQLVVETVSNNGEQFTGKIEWPSLASVNRISGRLNNEAMVFSEDGFIKRGRAILGCTYRFIEKQAKHILGEVRCPTGPGTAVIYR